MTSRRLVLAAADLSVTAISLAFWPSGWAKADPDGAGTVPFVPAALGTVADPIPPVRMTGFRRTLLEQGATVRLSRTAVSPTAQGASARQSSSIARSVTHPASSGSEQIPLLVGAQKVPQTMLRDEAVRTPRQTLGRRSLNLTSSLERSAA